MYRIFYESHFLGQLTSDDMAFIGASVVRPTKGLQFMTGLEVSQKLSELFDLCGRVDPEVERNELNSIQSGLVTHSTYDPEIADLGTGSSNAMPPVYRLTGPNLIDKLVKLTDINGIYGLSLTINEPLEALI
ncbi:hypothetical protein [Vibrio sp. 10N.239.312.D08]|uniref:hypothetical protein n=1 Tax=Vibrio sp. 10N.239.312.D08 TaxID=3229978 RepID=UPI003553C0C4